MGRNERNKEEGFRQILDLVSCKSPSQKKVIAAILADADSQYWQRTGWFFQNILRFMKKKGITNQEIVDAYLDMCHMMLSEEFKFRKTRRYSLSSASEANTMIYSSEEKMAPYLMGLALSQFLWPQHYALFDFFIKESNKLTNVNTYLEIGPGHGLYLVESLKMFPAAEFLAVDISSTSIRIAEEITKTFLPDSQCRFMIQDAHALNVEKKDYIVMCEVLEHLDCPREVLNRLSGFLNDQGRLFITTCANCPVIDHVYQYTSVNHIKSEIMDAGLEIVSDLAFPVNYEPKGDWYDENVSSSYAAMLRRRL